MGEAMEFFVFLALSVALVWLFFAWNDLTVLSVRLKALKEEIDTLHLLRQDGGAETALAQIDERLADARRRLAVSKAHYDRIFSSFTGSRLAAVLGFPRDPVAPAQAARGNAAARAA
jgi:hypothetical protein